MPEHIQSRHASVDILEEFEKEFAISHDERIHLKVDKGQPDRQPVKRGTKRMGGELAEAQWHEQLRK
jgi:hypothetical protein